MILRCDMCGRAFLEIDARRVAAPRPLCVECLITECERAADTRGEFARLADALLSISAMPAAWYRARRAG